MTAKEQAKEIFIHLQEAGHFKRCSGEFELAAIEYYLKRFVDEKLWIQKQICAEEFRNSMGDIETDKKVSAEMFYGTDEKIRNAPKPTI